MPRPRRGKRAMNPDKKPEMGFVERALRDQRQAHDESKAVQKKHAEKPRKPAKRVAPEQQSLI